MLARLITLLIFLFVMVQGSDSETELESEPEPIECDFPEVNADTLSHMSVQELRDFQGPFVVRTGVIDHWPWVKRLKLWNDKTGAAGSDFAKSLR